MIGIHNNAMIHVAQLQTVAAFKTCDMCENILIKASAYCSWVRDWMSTSVHLTSDAVAGACASAYQDIQVW